jgi:hypothetical protein
MGSTELGSAGRVLFVLSVCVMGVASPGHAQENREPSTQVLTDSPSPSQIEQRTRELERWIRDYRKWQEWRHQSLKKGSIALSDRKPQPQPPMWLVDDCRDTATVPGTLHSQACDLLTGWNDDDVTGDLRYQAATGPTQREAPTKTIWWEHVHWDAFWPVMSSESSVVGVLGAHVTVEIEGRFQVFMTPGVILLNVPTAGGTREWKPATDWGVAYRLFDFRVPMTRRPASFHVNFVRAWMLGNVGNLNFKSSVDLAGFSVTFKKRPTP